MGNLLEKVFLAVSLSVMVSSNYTQFNYMFNSNTWVDIFSINYHNDCSTPVATGTIIGGEDIRFLRQCAGGGVPAPKR